MLAYNISALAVTSRVVDTPCCDIQCKIAQEPRAAGLYCKGISQASIRFSSTCSILCSQDVQYVKILARSHMHKGFCNLVLSFYLLLV